MNFLDLPGEDLRDAYLAGSEALGKSATVLEKDVWVCWTLDALFSCPDLPHMAFKGGTSLSKAYNAIARFSEDIDVTMDCEDLVGDLDPFGEASRKQRDRADDRLRAKVREHSVQTVAPHIRQRLLSRGLDESALEIVADGDELHIHYPSVMPVRESYYLDVVKLEFGGRNITKPCQQHTLHPYIAADFPELEFPFATVDVLSAGRTFWEKFTLAHAESRRPEFKNAERLSRHWYDLAVLSVHDLGVAALDDVALLADVIKVKKRFFNFNAAEYDLCLSGKSVLLPDGSGLALLKADYEAMVENGMIDEPMSFAELLDRVRTLQDTANSRIKRGHAT